LNLTRSRRDDQHLTERMFVQAERAPGLKVTEPPVA